MPTVNWGVMSTAAINDAWLAGAALTDGAVLAAVASRDRERAERYAEQRGIPRAHGSYEALLADPGVDAVYISLPNSLHVPWTRQALLAGKHVLCEKPLSHDPAEVTELFDLADRRGLQLAEAFMYRHHPQMERLRGLVAAGELGPLRMIRSSFSYSRRPEGDVRLSTELGGGGLLDIGCYCVNASRMLAGEPLEVQAIRTAADGVDLTFAAVMRFDGDVLAHFDVGMTLPARDELEVVGELGSVWLDDPWHGREPVIERRQDGVIEQIILPKVDPYRLETENMMAAIAGTAPPLLGRDDAVGQARTLGALLSAAGAGPEAGM